MDRFCKPHVLLTMALLAVAPAAVGQVYRWVDEDGVVHYSDRLPPEKAGDAHAELDEHGMTREAVDRLPTEEERLAAERARQAQEAEARRRAEAEEAQRRRDELLLRVYTTERDLLIVRDDRLQAIDSLIALTEGNNARIAQQLAELEQRIEGLEKAGREVPENLLRTRENLQLQRSKNDEFIAAKRAEREALARQFEADLARFRELKAPRADEAAPAAAAQPPGG